MDAKKKMVEILGEFILWPSKMKNVWMPQALEKLADHLIANGITVQECKIGDKIYQTDGVRIYESTIVEITVTTKHTIFVTENIVFDERAIGETIFLSYSEAEAHSHKPQKGE